MSLPTSPDQLGLRAALRQHTAAIHQELDDRVGAFATAGQYRTFVAQSYRFRLVAEPACRGLDIWAPQDLVDALRQDLSDLDMPGSAASGDRLELDSPSQQIGALYVLEGSALGARLLQRRAADLGFTPDHGARHLNRQTSEKGRWKAFLDVLDDEVVDRAAALRGAQLTFEAALSCYSETVHEYA
jgi:heme oxygenase (biliverdin-IX-beta and delta-forming)